MTGEQNSIHTLADAFAGLDMEQQAHGKRVSKYAEIIFSYAIEHNVYGGDPEAEKELVKANIPVMAQRGLYHEIEAGSHRDTSYMGRILTLAHDLDEISMKLVSENPLEEAIKEMKVNVPGQYDSEFYKAMKSCKAKLNRVFKGDIAMSHAVPAVEPIIKRRATRPMELVYRPFCNVEGEIFAREASMRFRNVKDNTLPYDEVKDIIRKLELGDELCEYFVIELCDAVRRFEACRIYNDWMGIELLSVFYGKKRLAKKLQSLIEIADVKPESVRLFVSANTLKKPTKTIAENIRECRKKGILFVLTDVTREFLETTTMTWEEYPFAAIRFTSECLMDHSIQESGAYLLWKEQGVDILADDIESQSIMENVAENGAVGYTGMFAGIYEKEDDIVKRALQLH